MFLYDKDSLSAPCRTTWAVSWIQRRQGQGVLLNWIRELNVEDPEMFLQFHRLDVDSFNTILTLVGPLVTKDDTNMRPSFSPDERLVAILRFLATRTNSYNYIGIKLYIWR